MENASTYARLLIESLLNVHALTNMHRSSDNDEHQKAAAAWLPTMESQFVRLKRELLNKEPSEDDYRRPETPMVEIKPLEWSRSPSLVGWKMDGEFPMGRSRTC